MPIIQLHFLLIREAGLRFCLLQLATSDSAPIVFLPSVQMTAIDRGNPILSGTKSKPRTPSLRWTTVG